MEKKSECKSGIPLDNKDLKLSHKLIIRVQWVLL
jgi:hypothetical protein